MGAIALPSTGPVYLDANAVIYSVERIEPYAALLQPLWLAAQQGHLTLISSELLLLETLVKPLQVQDALLASVYRALLLESDELRLLPLTLPILEHAARLRAQVRLTTPDAIHAATATAAACTAFVTNDRTLSRIADLPVMILSDHL